MKKILLITLLFICALGNVNAQKIKFKKGKVSARATPSEKTNKKQIAFENYEIDNVNLKKESPFSENSLKELHSQLEKAVESENYELAAKIRDEISKRV